MENKISRCIKLYPWYGGLVGDLLFYIAIDTLFLTVVKNFSAAQIVSLAAFSQFACMALQFPILFIIKRIGNTSSVRAGALFLLLSAILITFGRGYYVVLLGRICHDIAAVFRNASYVTLANNLEVVGRRNEFVEVRTRSNTVYSVITMVISFVAGFMFNLNNYLPMFGCITTCTIAFILSFFIKDYSKYNKIAYEKVKSKKVKFRYSKFIILLIVVYGLFYPVVSSGQSDGKLFIQQNVLLHFSVDNTSLIIGAIVCVSRIVRVFSNVLFAKLYYKYQAKLGVALPVMLSASIGFMMFGSFVPQVLFKIVVMTIGYIIILFVRDPFKLYVQDIVFENAPKEQQQTLLAVLEFGVKLGTAGMGLAFSAVLLKFPMVVVMAMMLVISIIEILLSLKLYKMVMVSRNEREGAQMQNLT